MSAFERGWIEDLESLDTAGPKSHGRFMAEAQQELWSLVAPGHLGALSNTATTFHSLLQSLTIQKRTAATIREEVLSEGVAGFLALLSPKTDPNSLRAIFLLPLKKVIYKARGITLGSWVYVFSASPRETSCPLPGSLAEAVLEPAAASSTGWNHVDATI